MRAILLTILFATAQFYTLGQSASGQIDLDYRNTRVSEPIISNTKYSDTIEKYFITLSDAIEYVFSDKKHVAFNRLGKELDTIISDFMNSPTTAWEIEQYTSDKIYDSSYQKVMREIAQLPPSTIVFDSTVRKASRNLSALVTPEQQIHAIIYFGRHFFPNNDSNKLNYYYTTAYNIAGQQGTSFDSALCYEAIGDASYTFLDLQNSFQAYSLAWKIYANNGYALKLGDLETKIAERISFRSQPAYLYQAIFHMKMAQGWYDIGLDTINSSVTQLKLSLMWLNLLGNFANPDSVLASAYIANKRANISNAPYELRYYLYKVVGRHFLNRGGDSSLAIARKYFTGELIESFNDHHRYNLGEVITAFFDLARVNAMSGNRTDAIKLLKYAKLLSNKLDNIYWGKITDLENAYTLFLFRDTSEAIRRIKIQVESLDSISRISEKYRNEIRIRAYNLLSFIYSQAKIQDSAQFYENLYYSKINNYADEVSDIAWIITNVYNIKIGEEFATQEKSILHLNQSNKIRTTIIVVLIVFLAAYILAVKLNKRRLKLQLIKLRGEANTKLHNVKNLFNGFSHIVRGHNISLAEQYAEQAAYYLGFTLKTWDWNSDDWTIYNEVKLLYAYRDLEELNGVDVIIKMDFDDIDIRRTRFMPEVFPTLLQNSVKHGFKGKDEPHLFSITAKRVDKLIYIEIADNGLPSDRAIYLRADGPNKGLLILKKSIETVVELYCGKRIAKKAFTFSTDNGTTIKITYPYVATA